MSQSREPNETPSLTKSALNFVPQKGRSLRDRTAPFFEWSEMRRKARLWPYSRVAISPPTTDCTVSDEDGRNYNECINFGSQDYLGLARDQRVFDVAKATIDDYGAHSAGSPALAGRTPYTVRLEERISDLLRSESAVLYATGWAAGFGVITGLARPNDTIVIDRLAHNCLAEGAKHATQDIRLFAHNNAENLDEVLRVSRQENSTNGLFVVVESLYSMDSDSPNLNEFLRIVRKYDGILILDIAHDFGAMGEAGLGLLGSITSNDWPDVIMGSFSKTFASNGGFVAAPACVTNYLRYHSSPMTFSNSISPIQAAIVLCAFDIVFSLEGEKLRNKLTENAIQLRDRMESNDLRVAGTPSPIVPVYVGDEKLARLTSRHLESAGLLANLVEFPAVAKGAARFRFQVMSTHLRKAIDDAADTMAASRNLALAELLG